MLTFLGGRQPGHSRRLQKDTESVGQPSLCERGGSLDRLSSETKAS